MAPKEIGASAQSLIFIATNGIGLFLGTQLGRLSSWRRTPSAGSSSGRRSGPCRWRITLAGAIVFAVLFKVPDPKEFKKDVPKPQQVAAAPVQQAG